MGIRRIAGAGRRYLIAVAGVGVLTAILWLFRTVLVPANLVTIILPQFVAAKWWHHLLHNQTSLLMKGRAALSSE